MHLTILSLGCGTQSTCMALFAAAGKIKPMPDAAIFADPGWEGDGTYEILEWLTEVLPFPVHTVRANGNIREDAVKGMTVQGNKFSTLPFFTITGGMGRRQCTADYKIRPIRLETRRLLGLNPGERAKSKGHSVEQWIGITKDEASRMAPSRDKYIENRWPLIELGMSRRDCINWMKSQGHPEPPKSSCVGCPFKDDLAWKNSTPSEFADAVAFDKAIRNTGTTEAQFVHRSCKPLGEVDFSSADAQINMFGNECSGVCGV